MPVKLGNLDISTFKLGNLQVNAVFLGNTQLWQDKVPAGRIVFITSQVWTVPKGVKKVNVFLVGGGAAGTLYGLGVAQYGVMASAGVGGSGGLTATYNNVAVTPLSQISVVVGAGENVVNTGVDYLTSLAFRRAGASSFGSYSALGGVGAYCPNPYTSIEGAGGSGGGDGASGVQNDSYGNGIAVAGQPGGSDGSNGGYAVNGAYSNINNRQEGQGATTREFAKAGNTLYAGGGGGGRFEFRGSSASNFAEGANGAGGGGGTPNTGGGGYGRSSQYNDYSSTATTLRWPTAGGSGIVIVEWVEQ
jgi:hypothetical protein